MTWGLMSKGEVVQPSDQEVYLRRAPSPPWKERGRPSEEVRILFSRDKQVSAMQRARSLDCALSDHSDSSLDRALSDHSDSRGAA